MATSEINDLLVDIQEVFAEVGTSFSLLKPLATTPTNIYKETKKITYDTPILLTGTTTFSPSAKELSDIGIARNVSVVFKVAYQTLIDTGLDSVSSVEMLKNTIQFQNLNYEIVNYIPRSLYQGDFLIYNFECIRRDS